MHKVLIQQAVAMPAALSARCWIIIFLIPRSFLLTFGTHPHARVIFVSLRPGLLFDWDNDLEVPGLCIAHSESKLSSKPSSFLLLWTLNGACF